MSQNILGKRKEWDDTPAIMGKLSENIDTLKAEEKTLREEAAALTEEAKKFLREKNRMDAMQCLKKRKLCENQVKQLGDFQMRIYEQIRMLQGAKAAAETVDALTIGAEKMQTLQKVIQPFSTSSYITSEDCCSTTQHWP